MDERRESLSFAGALALMCVALASGCCARQSTPTIAASGQSGAYVHAGGASDLRAGLAQPPGSGGWPPAALSPAQGQCADEAKQFERSLGAQPIACPAVQAAAAPSEGDADAPIASAGFQLLCYELGSAMLVVEYTQPSSLCSHVVGLAVYHKK